jgi:hypothetical protein
MQLTITIGNRLHRSSFRTTYILPPHKQSQ